MEVVAVLLFFAAAGFCLYQLFKLEKKQQKKNEEFKLELLNKLHDISSAVRQLYDKK